MSILTSVLRGISSLFFTIVGWLLSKLKAANDRAKIAEEEARELAEASRSQAERERSHEKRVEEITSDNFSDDRVGELLSAYPTENTATSSTRTPEGRK